jgi:hypothetical protein
MVSLITVVMNGGVFDVTYRRPGKATTETALGAYYRTPAVGNRAHEARLKDEGDADYNEGAERCA